MLTPFDEELFVGSRFAERYQILSVVGRGSMGVVYKARHELMGRLVAIKMLRGQLLRDERSVKRFEREARATSRLDHPNVIAVHDFGLTENRQPYLVMDFASGVTLYEIQKRERILAPQRAVHIFSQVCDALQHAHLQGVIHRDLKPSNIMVMSRENDHDYVKVFDLGVAKVAWGEEEEKEALTGTGEVCGSPIYLSPEQCKHDPLDHRTDIYSLGVVMYELLTGMPPLMGETAYDTIYLHAHEEAPAFALVTDAVLPARLEKIVLKALSKSPDDRQQTMQELKWELQASLTLSDPLLQVLPPNALPPLRKRPGAEAPTELRESDKRGRGTGPRLLPNSARVGSTNLLSEPEEKSSRPVVMTAAVSSIISIAITLGLLAIFNSGKSTTKLVQPEPDSKMLNMSQYLKDPGEAKSANSSSARAVATFRKTAHVAPDLHRHPVASVVAPHPKSGPAETPHSKDKPLPVKEKLPIAQTAPTSNPFFSIFAAGKPPPPAAQRPVQAATPKALAIPKVATGKVDGQPSSTETGAQNPVVQTVPANPLSERDQRNAIMLNNEAVTMLGSDPENAIGKLQRAIKLNPQYTNAKKNLGSAWHNLAIRQRSSGDTFAAVNSYRYSLDLLTEVLGKGHPATLATQQEYENLVQSVGASPN